MESGGDSLTQLTELLRSFTAARNWTDHHTPKNLAMALAGEVGELVTEFQWLTGSESERANLSPEQVDAIEAEMADVLIYLVQLADRLDIDLPEAAARKMAINATRFPVPANNPSS